MGLALFIALSEKVDFDDMVNGRAVARAWEFLDKVAANASVKALADFISMDLKEFSGAGADENWQEEWFSPTDGLIMFRAFLDYLDKNDVPKEEVQNMEKEWIIDDLKGFEQVLVQAEAHSVKWHLEVDI